MFSGGYSCTRLRRSNRAESWYMRRALWRTWRQREWWRVLNGNAPSLRGWRSVTLWHLNQRRAAYSLCGRRNRAATACASQDGSGQLTRDFRAENSASLTPTSQSVTLSQVRCDRDRRLLGHCCLPRPYSVRPSGSLLHYRRSRVEAASPTGQGFHLCRSCHSCAPQG